MSSKCRRAESSRFASNYDQTKFVSFEVVERYRNVIEKKNFVLERGLRPDPQLDGKMAYMIAERNWFKVVEHPEPAVIPLVKEFYANTLERDSYAGGL